MKFLMRSIALCICMVGVALAEAPDDPLQHALTAELARSMAQLKLDDQPAPYYVAYEVTDARYVALQAVGGVLSQASDNTTRVLNVDVRIGTPQSDSSRVMSDAFGGRASEFDSYGGTPLPLGDDIAALRRKIWIATDIAYKRALEDYATRQAVLGARAQDELPPDQILVPALQQTDDRGELRLDLAAVEPLLREISAALEQPAIEQSVVWLNALDSRVRFLDSAGTATLRRQPGLTLGFAASTRAADGEPLIDHRQYRTLQPSNLPAPASLVADATELATRLTQLRSTESLRDYTGPVLFSGDAAAQLFALRFAPKLGPLPRFHASEAPMQGFVDQLTEPTQGFARRIGARVLPAGSELVDDPTLRDWNGVPLPSAAAFDSEGVATRRKVLVADGRLADLLSTRAPAILKTVTPGNLNGTLPASSTLILRSDEGVDAAGMRREIDLLLQGADTPWILEVERFSDEAAQRMLNQSSFNIIFGGGTPALPRVARASKLFPDGHREPLRGLELADIGEREFRHIVAIGDTPTLFTASASPFSMLAMLGRRSTGVAPQTYLVPPLLFEELSAAEDTRQVRRVPLLAKPSGEAPAKSD